MTLSRSQRLTGSPHFGHLPCPYMTFAPDSLRNDQDSDGGEGSQCPSPLSNGNSSWSGSDGLTLRCQCQRGLGLCLRTFATSCLIGEPLALDASESNFGTSTVINSQLDPIVVAEIELRQIPPQLDFADFCPGFRRRSHSTRRGVIGAKLRAVGVGWRPIPAGMGWPGCLGQPVLSRGNPRTRF